MPENGAVDACAWLLLYMAAPLLATVRDYTELRILKVHPRSRGTVTVAVVELHVRRKGGAHVY